MEEIILAIFIGSLIYFLMGLLMAFVGVGIFDIEFPTENYELHGVIVFWPIIFIIFVIILIIRSFTGLKNIFIHLSHL
jgi:hypothetical protein